MSDVQYAMARALLWWRRAFCLLRRFDLTLACGPHNRLAEHGWTTRNNTHGDTEWIPPPHLDYGQPRTNTFHHPEKMVEHPDDDP